MESERLVSYSTFQSISDLDEYREYAKDASLEVLQLGRGRLEGYMVHSDLGSCSIHTNCFSLPVLGRGVLSPDRFTFVLFPNFVEGVFNTSPIQGNRFFSYPPNFEFEGCSAGRLVDYVITIGAEEFTESCEQLHECDVSGLLKGFRALTSPNGDLKTLRSVASSTLSVSRMAPNLLRDPAARAEMDLALKSQLFRTVASAVSQKQCANPLQEGWALIRMAEQQLRLGSCPPLSQSSLCRVLGTSERTLRRAFRKMTDMSPSDYLRAMRFNQARTVLEQSLFSEKTVTEVALKSGFAHLGRFSKEYRAFFGELPSETLRRSVRTCGPPGEPA